MSTRARRFRVICSARRLQVQRCWPPPNGLPISCGRGARHGMTSKYQRSRARSGRLQRRVGRVRPEHAKLRHAPPVVKPTRATAFGGTTLTGTTSSTTGVHPTIDSFRRSGTASERVTTRNHGSRTRRLYICDPPNGLPISGAQARSERRSARNHVLK